MPLNYWNAYNTKYLEGKYLYKFLQKEHLIDFLITKIIWFSRADQFGDKMECVHISDLQSGKPDFKKIESRKRKFLMSCWHLANNESLALWDKYVTEKADRRVAAIRFERKQLLYLIKDSVFRNDTFNYQRQWFHGAVLYMNLLNSKTNALDDSRVSYPAIRKEKAFSYENEYRFVVELPEETTSKGFSYHLLDVRPPDYDILLNPLLDSSDYLSLKNEIEGKGFGESLKKSALNRWLHPEEWEINDE